MMETRGMSVADTDSRDADDGFAPERDRLVVPALIVAGIAVLALVVWGVWQLRPGPPGDTSAEAGFARDMSVHHDQAVQMALLIRDRTDDENLRLLATDIILTQQAQIGHMQGWLNLWDLRPTGGDPPMTWMGHTMEGPMPGMATADQVRALREMPVDEAEIEFLRLMIAHHIAGVSMAEAIVERTDQDDVLRLANSIIAGQQSEIELMQSMLRERGAPVSDAALDEDGESAG